MGRITYGHDSHDSHDDLCTAINLDVHESSRDVATVTDNNCIHLNQSGRG
jgi:hypothetical protein